MRAPARPGTSTRNYNSLMSSPARSTRSRAGTVSPRKASGESHDDHHGPPPRPVSGANINVVVRCRGRSEREKAENSAVIVSHPSTTEVALALGPLASIENKIYTFDRTFGPEADQQRIYDNVVQPLLNEVSRSAREGRVCDGGGRGLLADDRCWMVTIVPSLRTDRPALERHTP